MVHGWRGHEFNADIFDRGGRSRRFWDDRRRGIATITPADETFFAFYFEFVISFII
jgi:hypothetical protein